MIKTANQRAIEMSVHSFLCMLCIINPLVFIHCVYAAMTHTCRQCIRTNNADDVKQ